MSSYPPTPQRKACDCSDPCISTDDVYYAGPNLPNSGINTYNVLTSVIEKLDAIYAVPTLQKVTETGNLTTLPIIADSFVKIGGDGNNILLDDGNVLPIGDLPGNTQTLAETLVLGNNTGGTDIYLNDADSLYLENGSYIKKGNYDFGASGGVSRICGVGYEDMWQAGFRHVFDANGFIRNSTNCFNLIPDIGSDVTRRYKIGSIWTLDDLTNYICTDATEGAAVWELYKEIPATALVFLDEGNGNGIVRSDRDPAFFGNIGLDAFDISFADGVDSPTTDNGATGEQSFAAGISVRSRNYLSSSFGYLINNNGEGSFDTGYNLKDTGYTNFVTGMGHDVTSANSTVVGQASNIIISGIDDYNAYPTKPLFVVGNGTMQNADPNFNVLTRSDAFIVRMNGLATLPSVTNALIDADITGKAVVTKQYISEVVKPYKVYTALLTRTGATAPTATILENTIGTLTFSYVTTGVYSINSSSLFTLDKTVVFIQQQASGSFGNVLGASRITVNSIQIFQSTSSSGTNDNNWGFPVSIEIRVYN